ncbi:MAG: hypothetical protein ACJ8GN_09595 [Longimicrobiaceae bacterium]
MRKAEWLLALPAMMAIAAPAAGQRPAPLSAAEAASLQVRMREFLAAVDREASTALVRFFPRAGALTWVHTLHADDRKRVSVWRFPPADLPRALKDGPLWPSFGLQPEGQPIGLFYHQVMTRKAFSRHKGWRRVRGTRFVPPGEPETAGLFVQWRREGDEWVVAAYGDERFRGGKLPEWCC